LNKVFKMRVIPVPCLQNNYAYLVLASASDATLAVDGVQPNRVLSELEHYPKHQLTTLLTTHHHVDHAGGNMEFHQKKTALQVVGGDERIPAMTQMVRHGDRFNVGSLEVQVLGTACHTRGSVSYYVTEGDEKVVFTGDTLFIGGCGRFFEGIAEEMLQSLDRLATLPGDTKVYCGHEYTLNNLKFALSVDPDNEALREKLQWAQQQSCTVPSTIAEELSFNPFMRTREAALQRAMQLEDPVEMMQKLRDLKDRFQG